jgi:carbonic anhydrase
MSVGRLLDGHRAFTRQYVANEPHVIRQLAAGQSPEALVVCCSDSRVVPELITSAGPGSLFVVRNVGNLIPPHGSGNQSVGAGIAYAVDHLHVKHLIVLGHYGCGGMAALRKVFGAEKDPHGHGDDTLPNWLTYAKASWDELVASGHVDAPDWNDRLVEENVLQQLAHAIGYPTVRRAAEEGRLQLHAWCYQLSDASLRFWDSGKDAFVGEGEAASQGGAVSIAEVEEQDRVR